MHDKFRAGSGNIIMLYPAKYIEVRELKTRNQQAESERQLHS